MEALLVILAVFNAKIAVIHQITAQIVQIQIE